MSSKLHPYLKRKLEQFELSYETQPNTTSIWKLFLDTINKNYMEFEEDRLFLERSMTLTSRDLNERYEKNLLLLNQVSIQKDLLNDLLLNKNLDELIVRLIKEMETLIPGGCFGVFHENQDGNLGIMKLLSYPNAPKNYETYNSIIDVKEDLKKPCAESYKNKTECIYNNIDKKNDISVYSDYCSFLLKNDVKSILCFPVLSNKNFVHGVFTFYTYKEWEKDASSLLMIKSFVGITSMIIAHWQVKIQLEAEQVVILSKSRMATIGELAGGVAHEINNPLFILEGYLDILKDMVKPENYEASEVLNLTNEISATVSRIANIVQNLNQFGTPEEDAELESASVHSLIQSTIDLCKTNIIPKNTNVFVEHSDQDSNVLCKSSDISQAIMNLITNSVEAVRQVEKKWIKIKTEQLDNHVLVRIIDSGEKPSLETQSRLFESFFTTKPAGKGSGLGLSLSKKIVNQNNGDIYFNEDSSNTEFVIKLVRDLNSNELKRVS